jgi:hypothetical protein
MIRPEWDFEYRLVQPGYAGMDAESDVVVALRAAAPHAAVAEAMRPIAEAAVATLLQRAPIFWYRVRAATPLRFDAVTAALQRAGFAVRYVTSALRGNLSIAEPLELEGCRVAVATDWRPRERRTHLEPKTSGRWVFHEPGGVDVDRDVCGTGAGARLAVIDDEARDPHLLPLDREVLVGTNTPSRAASHGPLMVAWSVGSNGDEGRDVPAFTGIAPDASPRLYLIPKAGREIVNLPCALVRAVDEGADVVVCATPIDGATSPLLDDALSFANRLGRGGRGTAVVVPTGREIGSPPGSLHASLTLALGDPASDARVLCVSPSGRDGGWFTWTDKNGKLRPFANRGPAVHVAAPGDDMSHPFLRGERLSHAESSGASAIAAGVATLVVATNPELTVSELYDVLARTSTRIEVTPDGALADPADLRPAGRDADGHDAKCGYGRISAARACLAVADPVASSLVEMGDDRAARTYLAVTEGREKVAATYSLHAARWAARVARRDPALSHALRVVLRHLRLVAADPERRRAQPTLALARQIAHIVIHLASQAPPENILRELLAIRDGAVHAASRESAADVLEKTCFAVAARLWGSRDDPAR